MGTKTISLENSAYARLKAVKRPGESFSDAVNRMLGGKEPSFLDFRWLLQGESIDRLAGCGAYEARGCESPKAADAFEAVSSWASPLTPISSFTFYGQTCRLWQRPRKSRTVVRPGS